MTDAAGSPARLAPLAPVIHLAEQYWGEGRIRSIDIRYPGYSNGRIVLSESIDGTVATGAGRLVFDGVTGELLHNAPSGSSPAKRVRDVFLGLHEGLFAAPAIRWLYFFSGLLGTGMVATGLIMWAVKRRQRASEGGGGVALSEDVLLLIEIFKRAATAKEIDGLRRKASENGRRGEELVD